MHQKTASWFSIHQNEETHLDCQSCGACCAYSSDCLVIDCSDDEPIFTEGIPAEFVDGDQMLWDADRCAALKGCIGHSVSCGVYAHRPKVCREFLPDSEECSFVRSYILGADWLPQKRVISRPIGGSNYD